ncbi:MAG: hypothetical protein NC180_09435 [Muribaculaceae bacterium]|nr:hypothetical protein [Roseburia sp.]MCM1431870.1 hypothetical protein [Muribaculaceae bacterium]MCM1493430.1 hypothetical protein [Muribaculaceae bacterium]
MGQRRTYFLLNKERDFRRGSGEGILIDAEGITLTGERGIYRSRVFDSGERGMGWQRLVLEGDFAPEQVSVTVCASEREPACGACGQEVTRREYPHTADMLLFDVDGRYLWLEIRLFARGRPLRLRRVRICFPRHTWLAWLPEIYQEDGASASFLERYLGIFQSLYEDMTEEIERFPSYFSPRSQEALEELSDWLGIPGRELWDQKQLARLVANAAQLSAIRGTAEYLRKLLWLGVEKRVYIAEYCQISPFFDGGAREKLLRRLYAGEPYEFTLLVEAVGEREPALEYRIGRIVELAKPAHMECRIVMLGDCIFLDRHSYLGINSVLGRYRPLALSGSCALSFAVLAGEGGRQR